MINNISMFSDVDI